MLSIDDFKPITLESKPFFDDFYKKYPPLHSDFVFSTMISWTDYAHYMYAFIDDALFIKIQIDGKTYFRPPLGSLNKDVFDEFLLLIKKESVESPITMITDDVKQWIEKHYKACTFISLPEYDDYVYRTKDLATLEGPEYSKIRNRLNKFVRSFTYQVEPINKNALPEVRRFLKRWCIWRDCEGDPLLSYEKKAVMFATKYFEELDIQGISIRVNDHIEAIAIYEQMNPETVIVHFEKGSPYYDGIYKVINMETAKRVVNDALFINRESDMGNPGLKKAKQSYRPDHMVHVYKIEKI